MATSTTTAPRFMRLSISRVTSFGAAAPGTSTAPITRSASLTHCSTESRVENKVVRRPSNVVSSQPRRGSERSRMVTFAPMPTAIRAAL